MGNARQQHCDRLYLMMFSTAYYTLGIQFSSSLRLGYKDVSLAPRQVQRRVLSERAHSTRTTPFPVRRLLFYVPHNNEVSPGNQSLWFESLKSLA